MPAAPKPLPDDGLTILPFACAADFEKFLDENHSSSPGIHLQFAKKASGIPSVTPDEAVETALRYGWIDGRANSLDEKYWLVRFTQRRAKSIWSKKNVDTVTRLVEEGTMHESGLRAVEAAKQDGRWARAYAGPATIQVPKDLEESLDGTPPAKAFFATLNSTQRYSVLWRIETASPQTRSKRIEAIVQMLAVGNVPGSHDKAKVKSKSIAVKKNVKKRSPKT